MEKIRIGVSACLMGELVRYDGHHKHDSYITGTLSEQFEFVPVCPEFELGLGAPREPMRLEGDPDNPCLVVIKTKNDLAEAMLDWSRERVRTLEKEKLCGFIFKSRSPSCGMERVDVYLAKGVPVAQGSGLFAQAFMDHFPLLPVVEEESLHVSELRTDFIERASFVRASYE